MLHISIEAMILTNGPILINLSEDLCQKKLLHIPTLLEHIADGSQHFTNHLQERN